MKIMDVTVTVFDKDGNQIGKAIAGVPADKFYAARVGWDGDNGWPVGAVATATGAVTGWDADGTWGPGHGGKERGR